MKYAIISDIHANPAALTAVLSECDRLGVGQVVCAGDVVGYGPDPVSTIRILRERGIPSVMGNHDAAVAWNKGRDCMIPCAARGVLRHRSELGEDDLRWLQSLPYVYEGDGFAVAHAGFRDPDRMRYTFSALEARNSFIRRSDPLLFIGHTHLEALYVFGMVAGGKFPDCGNVHTRDFRMVDGWQYLINVGSVGYPREHLESSFVTYDSETRAVKYHRLPFDFEAYVASLAEKGIEIPYWVNDALATVKSRER